MALAVKRGELSRSDVSKEVTKIADKMSEKDIKKFAKTKHADLPVKVQEILSYIYEANAVSGGKIHKFITGKNLTFKGKKYDSIEFEVLSIDNVSQSVGLRILFPKKFMGQEIKVPFKTLRRGPFLKTDTSKLEQVDNLLSEIPMGDLKKIDAFADKKLSPNDVVLTGKHFFDRLNDKRNKKEISNAELIGFFKRLSRKKKEFLEFLKKYKQVVATDNRTNINIPFMVQANRIIAKTIMRKKGFTTTNKTIQV